MADLIKHRGIVEKIDGSHVIVRIVQTSACSSCSAKGLCNASESKEKLIDIYGVQADFRTGEEVVVCGTTSMGMKAVILAFGIPVLNVFLALFFAMKLTDGDELKSALIALALVIPYFIVIYFIKDKLDKTFSFTIEKQ